MQKLKRPYYNFNKILSFNAIFNFIIGGRGLGKTYGGKRKAIKDFIDKEYQFIYLRRYKTELKSARVTFFDDLIARNEFPDWDFQVKGYVGQIAPKSTADDKKRVWKDICFFIALSTSQKEKSVAFPNVRTILFDEFIIEKGLIQYIVDEATVFLNFFSTVDRYEDKTKAFFFANSVSITNPYFLYYEIEPKEGIEFITRKDGLVKFHFPDSKDFADSVMTSKFGKLIADTEYAEYAVGNKFSDNNENMLAPKGTKARYMFTLDLKNGFASIWFDMFTSEYYVQAKRPKDENIYVLDVNKMDRGKTLMAFSDQPMSRLRTAFNNDRVSFDKAVTRQAFTEIFKRR
jgi:hypothetical protein